MGSQRRITPGLSSGTPGVGFASVLAALERNGIAPELLDEVGLEGLHATETRVITNNGVVTDGVEVPDYHARLKYWREYNLMVGRLGKEDPSSRVRRAHHHLG